MDKINRLTHVWLVLESQMHTNDTVEPTPVIDNLIYHEYDEACMGVSDIHSMDVVDDDGTM